MSQTDHVLEVWGDLACFTRPEMKVERFSYPVITPSAVRGIYDAIYCKPKEFRWQVSRVEILAPVAYIALRRNEVKDKVPIGAVQSWMAGKENPEPLWADGNKMSLGTDQKGRTQRQTMALKNVRYRLHACIRPWPGFENGLKGMGEQFLRRAAHGKCVYQPCFGCREFPAYFEPTESSFNELDKLQRDLTMDLGFMLYDVFDLSKPGSCDSTPSVSLFKASICGGVLQVPPYESADVIKPMRRAC